MTLSQKRHKKHFHELSKTNKAEAKGKVAKTSIKKEKNEEIVYSKGISKGKEVEDKKVKKSAINRELATNKKLFQKFGVKKMLNVLLIFSVVLQLQ